MPAQIGPDTARQPLRCFRTLGVSFTPGVAGLQAVIEAQPLLGATNGHTSVRAAATPPPPPSSRALLPLTLVRADRGTWLRPFHDCSHAVLQPPSNADGVHPLRRFARVSGRSVRNLEDLRWGRLRRLGGGTRCTTGRTSRHLQRGHPDRRRRGAPAPARKVTSDLRFGIVHLPCGSETEFAAAARRCESLGFDFLAAPDHLGSVAPFAALVAAGMLTTRIRLRTYVLNVGFWNPALLVREALTADLLTNGRLELGLGAGHMKAEFEDAGIRWGALEDASNAWR